MTLFKHKKATTLLVSLVILLCVTVGGTIAFLITADGPIVNVFNSSNVTTQVHEDSTADGVKSGVKIQNTGDTDAYIRAAVVVTWQDRAGNVLGQKPVAYINDETAYDYKLEMDYSIANPNSYKEDGEWILAADGYYYWSLPVAPNEYTGELITSCTMNTIRYSTEVPNTYSLNVEIIGSGIQSVPVVAITSAWASGVSGVNSDGTLICKTAQGGGN